MKQVFGSGYPYRAVVSSFVHGKCPTCLPGRMRPAPGASTSRRWFALHAVDHRKVLVVKLHPVHNEEGVHEGYSD